MKHIRWLFPTNSIAALPFQNLSGDPEQEYLADGVVEDIITALSRIRWLFVSIDVHKDRLIARFKSVGPEEGSHSTDGQLLSIPWQKPPSRKSR
jgi:TolB-like protein